MIFEEKQKTHPIDRKQVWEAFKQVRASGGSAGVDGTTIDVVGSNPRKYLYPVWSRMASGSYFPKPVRQVLIPKNDGTMRPLGIPTVTDRVAQMVVKQKLEELAEKHLWPNRLVTRPKKSQQKAIE